MSKLTELEKKVVDAKAVADSYDYDDAAADALAAYVQALASDADALAAYAEALASDAEAAKVAYAAAEAACVKATDELEEYIKEQDND